MHSHAQHPPMNPLHAHNIITNFCTPSYTLQLCYFLWHNAAPVDPTVSVGVVPASESCLQGWGNVVYKELSKYPSEHYNKR